LFAPATCDTATVAANESEGAYEAAETPNGVAVAATAFAGATDRTPAPNAATATSAMRLRSVFVDICFLSISQNQEFPDLGLGD
jgi:hypothetical protein